MSLGPTVLIYLLLGFGVALAVLAYDNSKNAPERWFSFFTAIPFWPIYVPVLLARKRVAVEGPAQPAPPPADDMTNAIHQVDAELEAALNSLDGWAEGVLARRRTAFTSCARPGRPRASASVKWIACWRCRNTRSRRNPFRATLSAARCQRPPRIVCGTASRCAARRSSAFAMFGGVPTKT